MDKQSNQGATKPQQGAAKPVSNKDKQKSAEAGASQKEGKTKAELKAERRAKQVGNINHS